LIRRLFFSWNDCLRCLISKNFFTFISSGLAENKIPTANRDVWVHNSFTQDR
jgi:hypothetical protein